MKKIFTNALLMIALSISVHAQVGVSIQGQVSCPGDTILIPVNATAFNDVGAITFFIRYDTLVLKYMGHQNVHASLSGLLSNAMTMPETQVGIVWNATISGVYIGNDKLFDLKFVYLGGADTLSLTSNSEIVDFSANVLATVYTSGIISQGLTSQILAQPLSMSACAGSTAQFTVSADTANAYEWQANAGAGWITLSNTGVYSGVNTNVLSVSPVSTALSGTQYRSRVILDCPLVSQTATLTVVASPNLNAGSDAAICADGAHTITASSATNYASLFWQSSGSGSFINENTLNPTYTPSLADTIAGSVNLYLFAQGNAPCGVFVDSMELTIKKLPNLTFSSLSDVCIDAGSIALTSATPSGGSYSGTGVINNIFNTSVAGIGTHTITYHYTDLLTQCSNTISQSIAVLTLPVVSIAGHSDVCVNSTPFALTGGLPAGGSYSIDGISSAVFNPATLGVGQHVITYNYTDPGTNCSNSAYDTVIVLALPTMGLNPFASVCINTAAFTLTGGTPSGGTYSGTGVSLGIFNPSVAGTGSHIITYTYTDPSTTCTNSIQQSMVVNALPTVTFSYNDSLCNNEPPALLTGSPSGGTFTGPGVSNNFINPAIAGPGLHWVVYHYTNPFTTCSNSDSDQVKVLAAPQVVLAAFSSVCVSATTFALSGGTPAGGTYTGTGVSGGNFNPATAGVGVHTITYTYTSSITGCSEDSSRTIAVLALPTMGLAPFTPVCINTPSFTLTGGTPSGGTYSGTGVSLGLFNPSVAGTGTHIITYTYTDPSTTCINSIQQSMVVNALPTVTFSYNDSLCNNEPPALLTGSPSGGTFTGPGVSNNFINPAIAGPGMHWVVYHYTNPTTTCTNSDSDQVKVLAAPQVVLAAFSSVCVSAATFALSGGTPAGGTYTGSGVSGGNFNPATAGVGVHTITYTYTSSVTGCSEDSSRTITVLALPTMGLPPFTPVCINTPSFTLTGGTPSGGTYSGTGVSLGIFNPSAAGTGSHIITYTYTNPTTTCTNSIQQTIVVNGLPTVTFNFTDSLCNNEPPTLLTGNPSGGTFTGPGVSNNFINPAIAGPGMHWVVYHYTNPTTTCSNSDSDQVKVLAAPQVVLAAFSSVCVSAATFALSGGTPAGGTYSGTGVSGGNFNPATAGVGTHTITYTYTNSITGCSEDSSRTLTVLALPTMGLPPFTPVCINTPTFTLTGGTPSGGTYSGTGVSLGLFNPSLAGIGSHIITYTYTNPTTTCTNSIQQAMVVNGLPVVTFSYNDSLCNNEPPTLLSGSPSGGTFTGPGVSNNFINPAIAGPGLHWVVYHYTNLATTCTNSDSDQVKVLAAPPVVLAAFSSVCVSAPAFALSGGTPVGGTYTGTGVSGGNFNPATAGVGIHTITYTYTSSITGCSEDSSSTITVLALPTMGLPPFTPVCINTPAFTLTGGSPTGGTYSGTGVSLGIFNPSVAGIGSHPITYTYTDLSTTCTNSIQQPMVVNALPTVTFSYNDSLCNNEPPTLLTGNPSGGTFTGPGVSNNFINPAIAGPGLHWVVYQYTDPGTTCTNSDSDQVKVLAAPQVNLGIDTTICINYVLILNAGAGQSAYMWSNGSSNQTLTLDGATLGVGIYNYSVTITGTNTCQNTDSIVVIVDPCIGFVEIDDNRLLSIYPNPSNERLSIIASGLSKDPVLKIFDYTGKIVLLQTVEINSNGSFEILVTTSNLPSGAYLLTIEDNKGVIRKKLIVNH